MDTLIGVPIIDSFESNDGGKPSEDSDSYTWTNWHLKTKKGEVTIRWLGESNGYYSEVPDFDSAKLLPKDVDLFIPEDLREAPVYVKADWLEDHGLQHLGKILRAKS